MLAEHFGQKLQGDFDCSGFFDHPHALQRQEETFAPGLDACMRNRYSQASPPSGVGGCGAGRRLCWTAVTVVPCPPETCNLHDSTSVITHSADSVQTEQRLTAEQAEFIQISERDKRCLVPDTTASRHHLVLLDAGQTTQKPHSTKYTQVLLLFIYQNLLCLKEV